jgi:hypothetical protein
MTRMRKARSTRRCQPANPARCSSSVNSW